MQENPTACSENKCPPSLTSPNKQQESGDHKPRQDVKDCDNSEQLDVLWLIHGF